MCTMLLNCYFGHTLVWEASVSFRRLSEEVNILVNQVRQHIEEARRTSDMKGTVG